MFCGSAGLVEIADGGVYDVTKMYVREVMNDL